MMRRFSVAASGAPRIGKPGRVLLQVTDLHKKLNDQRVLFNGLNLNVQHGDKIGLVGANGAGKSTFLKICAGQSSDFEGDIKLADNCFIGFLPQEPVLDMTKTVLENVKDGARLQYDLLDRYEEVTQKFTDSKNNMDDLIQLHSDLNEQIEATNSWDIDRKVEIVMECLGCPRSDASIEHLSGGEKRRVALARLLLRSPDILVMDEPTNHLDSDSIAWLESYLQVFPGAVLAVTHDRYFLENVAQKIVELESGGVYSYRGNYSRYLEARKMRIEERNRKTRILKKQLKKEKAAIEKQKGSVDNVNKTRVLKHNDLEEELHNVSFVDQIAGGQLVIPHGPRIGDIVLEVDSLSLGFAPEEPKQLVEKLSLTLGPHCILGVVGKNGAGKSTFFDAILGNNKAVLSGSFRFGDTVRVAHAGQGREFDSEDHLVFEEIAGDDQSVKVGDREMLIRTYVAQFNFSNDQQYKKISSLSGGERNRVHLAKLLKQGCNLLMFDEPTNDLDVDTLRSLEEGLKTFPGSVMIISHDRWFLNNVCTHILSFEGDGKTIFHKGNFESFVKLNPKSIMAKEKDAHKKAKLVVEMGRS